MVERCYGEFVEQWFVGEWMDERDRHMKVLGEACIEWMKFSQVYGNEQS